MTETIDHSTPAPVAMPVQTGDGAWIDLEEAARRSGWNLRTLRHHCAERWLAERKARTGRPPGGGRPCWFVRDDADPAFARVKFPEQLAFDLRTLTEAQRRRVLERERVVKDWEAAVTAGVRAGRTAEDATRHFLRGLAMEGIDVTWRTLYGWRAKYRKAGRAGLLDRRGRAPVDVDPAADPFLDEVRRRYLHPNQPKLRSVVRWVEQIAFDRGWEARSYKQCLRMVKAIPAAVVVKLRGGDKAYVDEAEPFVERDYSTLASNEVWVGDHHQLDVIVTGPDGKPCRPWLTAWQDMRSRKIVGWHAFAHDPNQDTILRAFKAGVLAHGVPQRVYVDNGKDYDAFALQGETKAQRFARRRLRVQVDPNEVAGVFQALGVETTHCQAYHGQSKPIERFFGTLEAQFGKRWPTYCGNKPDNKPEGLAAKLARGDAPAFADFAAALGLWIEREFPAQPHAGDAMGGKTPDQVYAENLDRVVTAPAELLDLLTQKRTRPVKVGQNGITYHKLRYGQYEPAVQALRGGHVYLRIDPADVSAVSVWTTDNRFACLARVNRRLPANASVQDVREAMAEKRRNRRAQTQYFERRPRMHEDLPDTMARLAAERKAAAAPPPAPGTPPPSIRPVRSPLEAQLNALQRAKARAAVPRIAVGAEGLSLLDAAKDLDLDAPARRAPTIGLLSLAERLGD